MRTFAISLILSGLCLPAFAQKQMYDLSAQSTFKPGQRFTITRTRSNLIELFDPQRQPISRLEETLSAEIAQQVYATDDAGAVLQLVTTVDRATLTHVRTDDGGTIESAARVSDVWATHERTDMWYLKRYGLPALYWNLMLRGRA